MFHALVILTGYGVKNIFVKLSMKLYQCQKTFIKYTIFPISQTLWGLNCVDKYVRLLKNHCSIKICHFFLFESESLGK